IAPAAWLGERAAAAAELPFDLDAAVTLGGRVPAGHVHLTAEGGDVRLAVAAEATPAAGEPTSVDVRVAATLPALAVPVDVPGSGSFELELEAAGTVPDSGWPEGTVHLRGRTPDFEDAGS